MRVWGIVHFQLIITATYLFCQITAYIYIYIYAVVHSRSLTDKAQNILWQNGACQKSLAISLLQIFCFYYLQFAHSCVQQHKQKTGSIATESAAAVNMPKVFLCFAMIHSSWYDLMFPNKFAHLNMSYANVHVHSQHTPSKTLSMWEKKKLFQRCFLFWRMHIGSSHSGSGTYDIFVCPWLWHFVFVIIL